MSTLSTHCTRLPQISAWVGCCSMRRGATERAREEVGMGQGTCRSGPDDHAISFDLTTRHALLLMCPSSESGCFPPVTRLNSLNSRSVRLTVCVGFPQAAEELRPLSFFSWHGGSVWLCSSSPRSPLLASFFSLTLPSIRLLFLPAMCDTIAVRLCVCCAGGQYEMSMAPQAGGCPLESFSLPANDR